MYGVKDSKGGTEGIERMLRRFKRAAESAGILAELKNRRSYEKPSDQRRKAKNDAIRAAQMESMPLKKRKRKERRDEGNRNSRYSEL